MNLQITSNQVNDFMMELDPPSGRYVYMGQQIFVTLQQLQMSVMIVFSR